VGYRTEAEFRQWQARDPIEMLENGLKRAAQIDDSWLDRTNARIKAEIAAAFGAARLAPFPASSDAHEHLFAEA